MFCHSTITISKRLHCFLGDHLQCYWRDSKVSEGKGVHSFWEGFGYLSQSWSDEPSNESRYLRARAMHIPKVIQCGKTGGILLRFHLF